MDKKTAYKIVLDDLKHFPVFTGVYDAKHGKEEYMYGVSSVMEYIAYKVDDETGDEFSGMFYNNMAESERELKED